MKFTLTTLISIASLMTLVRGQDDNYSNPILVAKPGCQSMDQFQSTFEKLCPIWIPPPTASDGWYYDSTSFVRGGSDGNSPDNLATVNCLYTTRGGQKNVALEIVQSLGGAIANEGI